MSTRPQSTFFAVLAAFILAIPPVDAQDPAKPDADDSRPKAETILDGYVEATGGARAYQKLKSRYAKGSIEVLSLGAKGKIETWQQSPDKLFTVTDLGDAGRSERGTDGKNAWEVKHNPLAELLDQETDAIRLLEGAEKAHFMREATFNADLRWREIVRTAETIGEELVADRPAWKVQIVTKDGANLMHYYDKYTRLLVRVDAKVKTELGEVPVEVYPSEYKAVSGVQIPHKSTQKMLGFTQIATFETIEFNQPIDKRKFKPPPGVRQQLNAPKAKPPKKPAK